MKYLFQILAVLLPFSVDAQLKYYNYDKDLLTSEFHAHRRQELRAVMPENSVAVFFSNPIRNKSNDVDFEYHQDPNMYYFSGLKEPHSMLLVFKEAQEFDSLHTNEILFIQPRDSAAEVWTGRRLGVKGAKELLQIEDVYRSNTFPEFPIDFNSYSKVFFDSPEGDVRDNPKDRGDLYSLVSHFREKAGVKLEMENAMMLEEFTAELRQTKTTEELTLMINAIDYTCEAQKELMKVLNPEMTEYQSEAVVEYIFKKNGSEQPGFPSIIGGGENSCILHYISNRRPLNDSDLLVVDIGAEYHGYTADVTRTMPVNGKFSEEQKIIYNIVLEAQMAGIAASKKGNKFWEPGNVAKAIIQKRLIEIGLIENAGEERRYFMHGVSHYLGLDVHDVGLYSNLMPGQVITVEPGIYIAEGSPCDPKWWNIGVRIEDDILITDGEPENLSGCVPKTIEEIEALMQEDSEILKK